MALSKAPSRCSAPRQLYFSRTLGPRPGGRLPSQPPPIVEGRDGRICRGQVRPLIVCCYTGQPDFGVCRHEGVAVVSRSRRGSVAYRSRTRRVLVAYSSRSGIAPKSLCLTTAFAPVPAFLGGSCPLGCSLSAPATGGFSVVSPQYIRYAACSEKEKRAGDPLHGDTIAQSFLFCNGAVSGWRGGSWLGLRPPSAGGLAWPALLSHRPTLQRF